MFSFILCGLISRVDKFFICKATANYSVGQCFHTVQRVHFAVPLVESESRLVNVAAQMFVRHVMPRAGQRALEYAPDAFNPVGVNLAANVLTAAMFDGLVLVLVQNRRQLRVSLGIVRVNGGPFALRSLRRIRLRNGHLWP